MSERNMMPSWDAHLEYQRMLHDGELEQDAFESDTRWREDHEEVEASNTVRCGHCEAWLVEDEESGDLVHTADAGHPVPPCEESVRLAALSRAIDARGDGERGQR